MAYDMILANDIRTTFSIKQYDLRGIWWWDSTGLDVWIIKFVHYIDLIPNVLSLDE